MLVPVILSGGVGSRLWPLSRELYPKQLLALLGSGTLLQQTVERIQPYDSLIVVCQEMHRFLVAEQLEQVNCKNPQIMLEPSGRNTAPAIALAAWHSLTKDKDPTLLVMPADHLIIDTNEFTDKIRQARDIAEQGYLVTFGIKPQ